ncbi:MAG: hypothetical protein N3E46_13155, partial [Gemmataceae bacterium]|nr:hypothetical protein [Gemmataceae bacterium]
MGPDGSDAASPSILLAPMLLPELAEGALRVGGAVPAGGIVPVRGPLLLREAAGFDAGDDPPAGPPSE